MAQTNNIPQGYKDSPIISVEYRTWKEELINVIQSARLQTAFKVNADLLALYWNIGKSIIEQQAKYGWGSQIIEQLSKDLSTEFSDFGGFSERNLRYMKRFAEEYPLFPIVQAPLAEMENKDSKFLQVSLAEITWYHHISLISKVKNLAERAFYMMETAKNGWSRDVMLLQVENGLYQSKGKAVNNFKNTLPEPQSDLARDVFKDPYKFGLLGMTEKVTERDIEKQLVEKITDFLLEMGKGFAFVGRQYHLTVDGDDYFIDILMYHLKLHCYVVIELKAVEFIPEFVSKLNFYISAVDEQIKTEKDNPTIGLLLCKTKSNIKAEYSLRGITQPMGIAQYEIKRILAEIQSSFPTIEELEEKLKFDGTK